MRKIIMTLLLCIAFCCNAFAQGRQVDDFYYYRNTKVELPVNVNQFVVYLNPGIPDVPPELEGLPILDTLYQSDRMGEPGWAYHVIAPNGDLQSNIDFLLGIPEVNTVEYVIGGEERENVMVSNLLYVRLNDGDEPALLDEVAGGLGAVVLWEREPIMGWYTVRNENRDQTSIELANAIWETGLFMDIDPGFVHRFRNNAPCVSDALFDPEQWNLDKINACLAWDITTGDPSVNVAIVDAGIMESHQEFSQHGFVFSYDISNDNPYVVGEFHGTHVGGIVFSGHNDYEIAGVAPDVGAINIRVNTYLSNNNISYDFARAIMMAAESGARVVNNSWGDQNHAQWAQPLHSQMLESAIDYAIDNNVLLVFASGNYGYAPGHQIDYPADYREEILVVGATNRDDYRAYFSSHGPQLDLVAPGDEIYSAAHWDDASYAYASGTSMAAPHVTGVAGLIFSIRPDLNAQQVHDIINATAQKIRPRDYPYGLDPSHPSGTWNTQVGHGMLDAFKALDYAANYQYSDLMVRDYIYDDGSTPHGASCLWASPDIWLEDLQGNVVINPRGGHTYNVCVRVSNISDVASFGNERLILNWAKAGTGLYWRSSWFGSSVFNCDDGQHPKGGVITPLQGVLIPPVAAHSDVVVRVNWLVPRAEEYAHCTQFASDLWHFCLLARVHDGETIVGENQFSYNLNNFVRNSNNVAWRNISLLRSDYPFAVVAMDNPYMEERKFHLRFHAEPNAAGENLLEHADVYLRLDDALMERCHEAGVECVGGKFIDENTFYIVENDFALEFIPVHADEHFTIETHVRFYAHPTACNEFEFDLFQEDDDGVLIGGERYVAVKDRGVVVLATALEDQTVLAGETTVFRAVEHDGDAQYVWRTV
ncbi:MAG: protease, partial [bacterium P3]